MANAMPPERIEILAPKQQLSFATGKQQAHFYDGRKSFNLNRTIADKLTTLSGVNLNGQGGQFQSYSIRGFSRGRIRTEIDGIPIITDRRAGNAISFIAPDLFSDAMVIKGPSSSIYGSQALGGVVNLSTNMAPQTSLEITGQSGSELKAATIKHKVGKLALGLAYQNANNETAPNGAELNTGFQRTSGLIRYQDQQGGLTTTLSWLPSVGKDIGKSNSKYDNREVSEYPQEQHSLAQVQISSDQGWFAKLFHHYQNWDTKTHRFNQYQALTEYQSHTLGGQWLSQYSLVNSHTFVGLDWLSRKGVSISSDYELFQSNTSNIEHLSTNELVGEQDNLAAYANTHWQLGTAQVAMSLRYDWITQQSKGQPDFTEQKINGALNLNQPLSDSVNLTIEIANGFRYPTLSERFFNGSTPRGFIQGNQSLAPEASLGTQASMNWQANDNIELKGAFYYYDLNNYIERYRVKADLLSYRNLDQAFIRGFELEAIWYLNDNWEHQLTFQQQTGQDNQNQRLDDLLPKKLNWSFLASFNQVSLSHSISHYFTADNVGSSEATRKAYTLWDLSLNYQLNAKITFGLTLNNIGNERYYGSLDEDAPLQPRRSIKLTTTWLF